METEVQGVPRGCGGFTQPWSSQGTTAEPWRHLSAPRSLLDREKSLLGAGVGQMGQELPGSPDSPSRTSGNAKWGDPTASQGPRFCGNIPQELGF